MQNWNWKLILCPSSLVKAELKSILNFFAVFYATINVCCMTTALISLSRAMALWNFESAKNTFTWKKTLIYYAVIWIYSIGQFFYSVTNILMWCFQVTLFGTYLRLLQFFQSALSCKSNVVYFLDKMTTCLYRVCQLDNSICHTLNAY